MRKSKTIEVFGFDETKEWLIYKNIFGEASKKEKKKIKEYAFTTYKDWKNYVKEKYGPYSIDSLIEFTKCLNYLSITDSGESDLWLPYYIALVTVAMGNMMNIKAWEMVLLMIAITVIIYKAANANTNGKIKQAFYDEYIKIISELIDEKKNRK